MHLLNNIILKMKRKYDYDYCKNIIKEYEYLNDFRNDNNSLYSIIIHNKWSELLCDLKRNGSRYKRCIYCYEFSNNRNVYVGLTFNLKLRDKKHRTDKRSSVYKYCLNNNIEIPEPKQLTGYIDKDLASKCEEIYLKQYINSGWIAINKVKTGNLGGNKFNIVYTKDKCIELAKFFTNISDFAIMYSRAYSIIKTNEWDDEAFSHMEIKDYVMRQSKRFKKVNKIDIKTNKILETYDSISKATKENNISDGHISACCNDKRKTAGGFKWSFVSTISSTI